MIICDFCRKEILENETFVNLYTQNTDVALPVTAIYLHRECVDYVIKHIPKAKRVMEIEAKAKKWIEDIDYWRDIMWDIGCGGSEWHKGAASAFNTALGIVKDGHVMRPAPPEYRKLRKYGEQ